MASEAADIPQAVNEKIEAENRKLVDETPNIALNKLSKEEMMDVKDIPNEPHDILRSNFDVENVKNKRKSSGSAIAGESENFLNLSSMAKVSVQGNNSSPDAYEVNEKPDRTNKDACKVQSLEDEKLDNRQEESIATKETSSEEIQQNAKELSSNLDKVADRGVVLVEDSADATSSLKVEDSNQAHDSEEARIDTIIGETGAEKFGSGRNGKMEENFDVMLEKVGEETITFREDTVKETENECELGDPNNSEASFLKDSEDIVIQEDNKTRTAPEVSEVGDHSIQTAAEKAEENSQKQLDVSQIKHEEYLQNESGKLPLTKVPTPDTDHEGTEVDDLEKAEISEYERSSENYLPCEKPVESLHVAPHQIKTSSSCQNAETISPSLEQRLYENPREILSIETEDKIIDAADKKDVAIINPNEEADGSIPYCTTNDLNVIHQLEEGKENDGPSIDAHHNPVNNSNKEGGDHSLEDPNDSEVSSCEMTEDQRKETKIQVNDDQKMTSKTDDIETQMMDKEHDTTILSEATADETIKIFQEVNDDQKMTSKPDDIETQMMDKEHDTVQSEATAETIKIFQETKGIQSSENIEWKKDLNVTHPLEEGKDTDGPSIDAPVNNSNNISSKGGCDQINSLEDPDDSRASREVTEDQIKVSETQANDDQKMTSMPDDTETQMMEREHNTTTLLEATSDETIKIETQMMDREHDTTIQSTADELIRICPETTELEDALSSENIVKIVLLDENRYQHVSVASILEEKVAESFEGEKIITDMPIREVENSYQVDDGSMDNSRQIINTDSGTKENFTVSTAEKMESGFSFEQQNEMKEPETEDVAIIEPNEATGGSISYYSANDFNVTHPLEEGKDNGGPSIDAPINNSNNICSEGGEDQINSLEDQDDSEASHEVTEYQGKETESQVIDDHEMTSEPDDIETQRMDREQYTDIGSEATSDETIKICKEVNDDQKMTTKPGGIETQMMDKEQDTIIQSEAIADEAKICHEITQIEVTHSSENIKKIVLLDEHKNQHVSAASILEEKVAESFGGDKIINDIPSQQVGVSYEGHDGCIDNSTQIIKDSGAKENLTVLSEEMETKVSCEKEKKIEEPDKEILERRLRSQDSIQQIMMETDSFKDNFTKTLEENSAKESSQSQEDEGSKESKSVEAELSTREVLNVVTQSSAMDENLKIDKRNVIISEQEVKNAEKKGTGENFEDTYFSEDNKVKTLEHEEEPSTISTIQSSIQSEEEDTSSKDCLDLAKNLSSVSGISEGSRVFIDTTELAVRVGTENPKLKEVELLDKVQLDKNDPASEMLEVATSKPYKKEAESVDIKSECESISNLGENRDMNVSMTGGNEANETVAGEITKYEVENETQAALSNCNDQVAATGNVSQNTFDLNLEGSYNPSSEEQNLLPVSGNETKDDNSENIEGSSIIPDSSSAVKINENIDIEKAIVGQEDIARNADDFSKENLDAQKPALDSNAEHENRMEDLDINSLNCVTEKNLESVEPSQEPPSTRESAIELQGNKSNTKNTITAVVNDGIKAMEERNEPIGEVLISQHSLDGTVDTNDDGREHGADGKQHIDLIQEVEKANGSNKTTEQEEKVIEQDFESSQIEARCKKNIQLGADDTINRTPDCDQIIMGGSLSEEVQRENENADIEGKIKEQIKEESFHEDVKMIAVADVVMHEEKALDPSSIKNLLSDDSKEKITLDIAEGLNRKQEKSPVTEVPEAEKVATITSSLSISREENCDYKIVHEPSSFYDKIDAEDVQVLDDAITISSKENIVQVDPEESTELQVPHGEEVESMQQDPITVLEEIEEERPQNISGAVSKEKMALDIDENLNQRQEELSVMKVSEDEKRTNINSLASVATEENSDHKIVPETSSFHDKPDDEDLQVLDDAITISSKENMVQIDPEESTELQDPPGEKVESMQQDRITILEENEEQPQSTSEDVSTEENSDCKIVNEPSSFQERTDTEDVQVLDDSIAFSTESLVQVDPRESTELQVPCGEKVEAMRQDPITVLEEIKGQQSRNASEAISEAKGVIYEGAKRTTDNCKEITDSSSFVELDEISPYNPLQESRKETQQMGEDKGTEKQQDDLHTLAHTKDSTMEITQKDAPLYVARADGSEDTGVMMKLMAASLLASDENMVEEVENYEELSQVEDHSTKERELTINKEKLQKTKPIEDKGAKAQEEEAGKSKRSEFVSRALTLVEERDKDVIGSVFEAPDEDLGIEGEANKFADKADTTPSTVMRKEKSMEEICDNEKSTNSHDETPEITNATFNDLEGQEVESASVAETAASVPQFETVEAQHADIGIAVVEQSESREVEFVDEDSKTGAVYKSNDQNVEELKSWEFPTLTKNNAENSEKETDEDYEKGYETKCERAEAVIEDNITCDQIRQELPEKSLELLSKVQLFDNKLQSTENNNPGANEEGMEHGEETLKDEDSLSNSTKKEEVDNVVDSNLEILQPDKLEKVFESEIQVQSFGVITKGQTKTEEENLEAAKQEMRNAEIVAKEICEAKESKKINTSSEKTKDEAEAEAVKNCQLGSPEEETIPERYQEGEEKPEEYLKVKTEEATKRANEKVSGEFEEAFVNENVSEHTVFDNKAVEESKESIDGIFKVKEEGKIVEGITTIVNNKEKARELDDVYVETEREILSEEVKISRVAFLEHGKDQTGANEDTGEQNKNINFSPVGDAAAGELLDNENIISEAAPTKLIHETIESCEDNKEIVMQEKEDIERKDEKPSISESLGDAESKERQDKNQYEFEADKQLNNEVYISNKVHEKDEEQVGVSAGEVIVGEADSCSRQTKDGNEKPDFSSHSKDTSEISHSDGVLGIAKDNENSTDIRMLEKIFTGITKSEISELTRPNESGEAITSTVSKDLQPMKQDSEAISVNAEMHESKAGTASSDVQEATGVQSTEEEKAKEKADYKEMTETSTSMECAISTSKIKQGSAVEILVAVEDQETEEKLVKLQQLPHLHHMQDSEGKTEEDGPVDLQTASNITEDIQEFGERSNALSNKENLAETNPNESKEHKVSNRGKGLELIQRPVETDPNESREHKVSNQGKGLELIQHGPVPATLQQGIENQQPRNSSEAVTEPKDAIREEEKVTITNCNEFTEINSYMTSDKVSPSNMLQGSSSEAAQGTKDKNTPTQCHELPILSDIKYSDMERARMDVEPWVERVDGIDVTNVMQNLDAASVPVSDKQTVIDAYHTKNTEFFNSTVDNKYMPRLQQDTAKKIQAEGEILKPSELEQEEAKCMQEERIADETIESTKKYVSTEIDKASSSDLLQGSHKESSEMADHRNEGREPTVQKEEMKEEKTEEAEHEEEKNDEEKDNLKESSESKGSELGSKAPVLVDAGDVDTKVSQKKSHNILSGVGSKVKHSIAKVKKAIIGKSSHPKPPSPKEGEKH